MKNLLANNTILINIPLIGGDKWSDLARISNSDELKQYSVRDKYDRPIARKIVEDAGVERTAFGNVKSGGGLSFHFDNLSRVKARMSPSASDSLTRLKKHIDVI